MASARIKLRIWHLAILILFLAAAIFAVVPDREKQTDIANQYLLAALLDNEGFTASQVAIRHDTIIVSIETSEAGEYDAQLVAWWGSIFGNAALLKGHEKSYEHVIIENLVNGEPYAYVSANLVSVDDYAANKIDDATFWDEVLITDHKPQAREIEAHALLPQSALQRETTGSAGYSLKEKRNLGWLWPLVALAVIALVVLGTIHEQRVRKATMRIKRHTRQVKQDVTTHVKKHSERLQKHKGKITKKQKRAEKRKK